MNAGTWAALAVVGMFGGAVGAAGGYSAALMYPLPLPVAAVAPAAAPPEVFPSHSVTYYVAHLAEARQALASLCEGRLLNTTHRGCHNADKALYLSGEAERR